LKGFDTPLALAGRVSPGVRSVLTFFILDRLNLLPTRLAIDALLK
jgi:hypothetical protein